MELGRVWSRHQRTLLITVMMFKLGLLCTVAADNCLSSPCNNGATCLEHLDDYVCLCPKGPVWFMGKNYGFTGLNCTQDVDECYSNPCNGVKSYCVNGINGYSCYCPHGFGGDDCQVNVTTCSEETCQNGGNCVDILDTGPQCLCAAGYQGTSCEEDTDECQSEPCQNGAICKDGGYHCDLDINECASHPCQNNGTCLDEVDHYTWFNCDVEIDECEVHPCQNGGTCWDYIAIYSYECNCEGTGFVGDYCEDDIPECASDPCKHGATCLEGINQYKCLCWPGYEGENCQLDTDECEQHPCENDGECFQRSDARNYGMLPELSTATFTYEEAAGFICHCCQGSPVQYGVYCEVDINECDSNPCQNGATCEDAANSYRCHCPMPEPDQEPLGGRNCDVRLVGCQHHQCQHKAGCDPMLTDDGEHSYTCKCPSGWTGERCNTSTTFSFNSEGYIHMQLPIPANKTRREVHGNDHGIHMQLRFKSTLPDMVLYYRGIKERFLSLEIISGSLQARVKSGKVMQAIYPGPVNDGEWYQVSVTMDERLVLTVKGLGCEEGCQVKNEGHNHLIFLQPSSFQQLYDLIREGEPRPGIGMHQKDWCHEDPCMEHGQCVDMWVRARCQCHRPYYGESCEEEYPAWTFGHENITSYSTFNISETHGDNFTISFLMRSLKHNGLLLQLSREGKSYLTIYLKEGTVAIYSPYTTLLSEAKFVTDGNNNLVTIKVRYGHVVFPKAGNHRALGNVSVEAGDVAYVGGLPLDKSINNWGGNFKGCLQDIRLDHKYLTIEDHPDSLEVYQASTENVLRGCKSDDTCKDEPCSNGDSVTSPGMTSFVTVPLTTPAGCGETRLWCVDNLVLMEGTVWTYRMVMSVSADQFFASTAAAELDGGELCEIEITNALQVSLCLWYMRKIPPG
ncbi:unnamed protein product [Pleuronectes platessa]|uniref:Uncharacterized protein n=1 Tax=Pleuronectes platessa TaxID=8262 RepID=A0A9N7W242_PLEPL|nr:unnamed protein product [Pleuronectes platessa]